MSHRKPSSEAFAALRRATPRHLSSHLHPHRVIKDLHLRGKPQIVQPEVVDSKLLSGRPNRKLSPTA